MSKTIDIGTKINVQDLLASRLLIQANSGGGKSAIARVIMEKVYGIIPFIVMDVDGEYYTLKEKFGDVLVIGGQYCDVPISLKSAKLLPKEIISNRLSVVIDLSDLKMDDRILYAKNFLEALMELPKQYWISYFVFIEEAHKLCGQQDKYPSGPAVKDLMSRGRKMGFCGVLITQRISKLHKDAAAECNNKFIGRTFLDLDMNRAADELALSNKNDRLILRDLKPGHFYAFGTAIEPHQVHEVSVIHPETKMPKAGVSLDIKPQKPTDKLKATLAKLNELPQEAAKELKTLEDLRKENIKLKNEILLIDKRTKEGSANIVTAAKDIHQDQKIAHLTKALKDRDQLIAQQKKAIQVYEKRNASYRDHLIGIAEKLINGHGINISESVQISRKSVQMIDNSGQNSIGKCSREIIRFLAQYSQKEFTKAQVAVATGYSVGSGGFNNSISELNQKGFIIRSTGKLQVNIEAMSSIIDAIGEISHQDYNIETFKENLGKCERQIYEEILKSPQYWFSKQELADLTGYSADSGGFNNAISRLNTLELIERKTGVIRLNQELLDLQNA
jgi:hypothetical protein